MRCTRTSLPITHDYIVNNHIFEVSEQHSYLGILINRSLSWSSHMSTIVAKATKTLDCNLSNFSRKLKESVYLTMVTSQMEYMSAVWDMYYNSHIQKLEKVQHCAARWIYNNNYNRFSSILVMLSELSYHLLRPVVRCLDYKLYSTQSTISPACSLHSIISFTINENNWIIPPITFHNAFFIHKVISE